MSGEGFTYRGYCKDGKAEGPGIQIMKDIKYTGEWHYDKLNGCLKEERENGYIYWG